MPMSSAQRAASRFDCRVLSERRQACARRADAYADAFGAEPRRAVSLPARAAITEKHAISRFITIIISPPLAAGWAL